ncbi:NVEALA domain-containing protein [Phocaeicola coprophilus]|uniref:NVEALA domain-containing protein n=1 Tax=Phocaeicola coprophilus TaxID=387090 RepID=UPI003466269C
MQIKEKPYFQFRTYEKTKFYFQNAYWISLSPGYYYFCPSIQSVEMSDLTMANIEALANKESLDPGHYDVETQITDHFYNGSSYKQSKVVNCYEGGNYACSPGHYYRFKKEDGSWSSWTPA